MQLQHSVSRENWKEACDERTQDYANDRYGWKSKVLLSSSTDTSVFCNLFFLTDLRPMTDAVEIRGNTGVALAHARARWKRYCGVDVIYHPEGITNILSLAELVAQRWDITFVCNEGQREYFLAKSPEGGLKLKFKMSRGVYVLKRSEEDCHSQAEEDSPASKKKKYDEPDEQTSS